MDTPAALAGDAVTWLAGTTRTYAVIWVTALLAPWRCFHASIRPGDQTRAIGFAVVVVAAYLAMHAATGSLEHPVVGDLRVFSFLLWATFLLLVAVPVGLHLLTAVLTLVLIPLAPKRRGISETVQVVAFAMAPAVFVPIPALEVQVLAGLWGAALLAYGVAVVHDVSVTRAVLAAAIPAYLLFGMAFGAEEALVEWMRAWYLI